ncbi:hypothetical protein [Allonocardiopsis opalescens]|uniref:Uncharacterized protein n=1 Tax=Allonocardiopsis opalescens TaxID=1144618 RepID=A0A2T0PSQ8_9ACTN|nr:hypothetical protein [Allonocardiopsis opalescens]PRX91933.1 hypothetical protein CLV72_1126 [Allonocardiopsis opalescens]
MIAISAALLGAVVVGYLAGRHRPVHRAREWVRLLLALGPRDGRWTHLRVLAAFAVLPEVAWLAWRIHRRRHPTGRRVSAEPIQVVSPRRPAPKLNPEWVEKTKETDDA